MSQEFFKSAAIKRRVMMDCATCCASIALLIVGAVLLSKYADNQSDQHYIGGAISTGLGALCFLSSCFDFCRHSAQLPVTTDERVTLNP